MQVVTTGVVHFLDLLLPCGGLLFMEPPSFAFLFCLLLQDSSLADLVLRHPRIFEYKVSKVIMWVCKVKPLLPQQLLL